MCVLYPAEDLWAVPPKLGEMLASTKALSSVRHYRECEQLANFVEPNTGGVDEALGLTFGPDGNLYVSSRETDDVMRNYGITVEPLRAAGKPGAVFTGRVEHISTAQAGCVLALMGM